MLHTVETLDAFSDIGNTTYEVHDPLLFLYPLCYMNTTFLQQIVNHKLRCTRCQAHVIVSEPDS